MFKEKVLRVYRKVNNYGKEVFQFSTALTLLTMTSIGGTVFADPWDQTQKATVSTIERVQKLSFYIFIGCVVLSGLMFAFGDVGRTKATRWLPHIMLGSALVSGAVSLVTWWVLLFGGKSY
ncbi:TPA: TrbC/VirB2 family protein [Streptococcus agalactiae]|nr:TrbC/VirB2 family protein [Streptococcus agalactiae]HEO4177422.1 TrbC/VirB2 family protein [Streptococcus agalactiae]